jgi:hypothetical protein
MKTGCWKRLILIWDNASYHVNQIVRDYVNAQKEWLTIIHLPKKVPYMNPNERRVNVSADIWRSLGRVILPSRNAGYSADKK